MLVKATEHDRTQSCTGILSLNLDGGAARRHRVSIPAQDWFTQSLHAQASQMKVNQELNNKATRRYQG